MEVGEVGVSLGSSSVSPDSFPVRDFCGLLINVMSFTEEDRDA